jgi:hypothetical protein
MALLNGIISGERNVVQIGSASFLLREKYGAEIFERAIPVVVAQVQERRPPQPQGTPAGHADAAAAAAARTDAGTPDGN